MAKQSLEPILITEKDIPKLVLPDGYELNKVKTKAEKIKEKQDRIKEIDLESPPTNQELIEFGMVAHPYFDGQIEKERLTSEINVLNR